MNGSSLGSVKPYKVEKAAFFDLDNTLIKGSSLFYFFKGLVKHGEVTKRQIARVAWNNYRFKNQKTESSQVISQVTQQALAFVAGKTQQIFIDVAEMVVREFLPKLLFATMHDRIKEHQIIGHETWLVTAAPIELAEIVARELNMTGAMGTRSEVVNGVYSGNLKSGPMHGVNKANFVLEIAGTRGYDLRQSFAYSDSVNDLPMLVSVGNPHIVNPNKAFKVVAQKNNWPILETAS